MKNQPTLFKTCNLYSRHRKVSIPASLVWNNIKLGFHVVVPQLQHPNSQVRRFLRGHGQKTMTSQIHNSPKHANVPIKTDHHGLSTLMSRIHEITKLHRCDRIKRSQNCILGRTTSWSPKSQCVCGPENEIVCSDLFCEKWRSFTKKQYSCKCNGMAGFRGTRLLIDGLHPRLHVANLCQSTMLFGIVWMLLSQAFATWRRWGADSAATLLPGYFFLCLRWQWIVLSRLGIALLSFVLVSWCVVCFWAPTCTLTSKTQNQGKVTQSKTSNMDEESHSGTANHDLTNTHAQQPWGVCSKVRYFFSVHRLLAFARSINTLF